MKKSFNNLIRALIVDDEYLAREGMKNTINWKSYGCECCGEAENGIDGIEKAKELSPEIIITDIKMPGIDGIEMVKKIKEFLPNSKFIVITAYDEFEYARAAVKIDAIDFILKPIDEGEFVEAVKKAVEECVKLRKDIDIKGRKLLLSLMRGKDIANVKNELLNYNINFADFLILNVQNDYYENLIEKDDIEAVFRLNRYIKEVFTEFFGLNAYVIECHENKLGIVLSIDGEFEFNELNLKLSNLQKYIKSKCKISVTIGVSSVKSNCELKEAYEESKEALKNRLYKGKGSIIYFKDLKEKNFINWSLVLKEEESLVLKLKACDRINLEKQLKYIYYHLLNKDQVKDHIVKQVSLDIAIKALNALSGFNIGVNKVIKKDYSIYRSIENLSTIDEIYECIYNFMMDIIRAIRESNVNSNCDSIEKAIDYIKEHYNENICLKDIAQEVYLSESYLSRKMKIVTGISFVEYITKVRIEKAMQYLRDSNAKVTEVSCKVGYPDYRYFSHIFKKYTGYTPSQWRENYLSNQS